MLNLLKSLFSLFSEVARMFSQKQLLNAGAAENEVKNVQAEVEQVARATEVRDSVHRADIAVDDVGSLPDDGFRRN